MQPRLEVNVLHKRIPGGIALHLAGVVEAVEHEGITYLWPVDITPDLNVKVHAVQVPQEDDLTTSRFTTYVVIGPPNAPEAANLVWMCCEEYRSRWLSYVMPWAVLPLAVRGLVETRVSTPT